MEWRLFERVVYEALAMGSFDISDLTSQIYRIERTVYLRSLGGLIEQAGYEGVIPVLSDRRAVNQMLGEARWAARSIARTYNKDLERAIGRIKEAWVKEHGSLKGLNRNILASRLRLWARKRSSWKNRQIGLYHAGTADGRAVRDFLDKNGIQGRARVMPLDAICDVCKTLVSRGWMTIQEVLAVILPVHPWCPHFLEVEPDPASLPSLAELFAGQAEGSPPLLEMAA